MARSTEKEVLGGGAGLAGAIAIESGTEIGEIEIKARGYWEQVWRRFKRDKIAVAGGITIIFLLLGAFIGAPIAKAILGHGPNDLFYTALTSSGQPSGPFVPVDDPPNPGRQVFLLLGAGSPLGRDEFLRLLSRAQAPSEAPPMTGASDGRIIRSHILPHLVAPIIVYSTLSIASFIIAEAGLSYLGVGIKLPTASWGNLLQQASDYYTTQPWLMVWPGLAVLLTTLAFNLLGDGLRDAFDPRSTH